MSFERPFRVQFIQCERTNSTITQNRETKTLISKASSGDYVRNNVYSQAITALHYQRVNHRRIPAEIESKAASDAAPGLAFIDWG